jgi:hypothetical protein
MRKRIILAGVSGMVLGAALTCVALRVITIQSVQAAPQAADAAAAKGKGKKQPTSTAPCGPNIQGDLGKNTAKDSRCFELRFYTVDRSRDLHKRFREGEVEVFKKNGVDVMAVWQDLDEPDTLVYLLSYKDRAAREAGWAAFNADPKWNELRVKYFVPLTTKITFLSAADYSPLK